MGEVAELAAKLESEGERLRAFFAGLDGDQWQIEVYTEGTVWTIRDIVAHLMTAERAFAILFERIRRGGSGVTEDFAVDRYNASQQHSTKDSSPSDLLQSFGLARVALVKWLSGLAEEELDRKGRHPHLGVTGLREMIKMVYIHSQLHYRDVRRVLRDRGHQKLRC